mgnify:CR=1 FL=1
MRTDLDLHQVPGPLTTSGAFRQPRDGTAELTKDSPEAAQAKRPTMQQTEDSPKAAQAQRPTTATGEGPPEHERGCSRASRQRRRGERRRRSGGASRIDGAVGTAASPQRRTGDGAGPTGRAGRAGPQDRAKKARKGRATGITSKTGILPHEGIPPSGGSEAGQGRRWSPPGAERRGAHMANQVAGS